MNVAIIVPKIRNYGKKINSRFLFFLPIVNIFTFITFNTTNYYPKYHELCSDEPLKNFDHNCNTTLRRKSFIPLSNLGWCRTVSFYWK